MFAPTAFFALILERLFGYPEAVFNRIGHPVQWQGWVIDRLESRLNRPENSVMFRRFAGMAMLVALIAATLAAGLAATTITRLLPLGWLLDAAIASAFLAQKHLGKAVREVADGLDASLVAGREAVSHVVGRDPDQLDEGGVARAAIETLAENASDGVIAPLFWLLVGGLPGIAIYKAVNTADSMVGHRNARFEAFGWASARLDDVLNWIPARLTALLFVAAAWVMPGADPGAAWTAAQRDAPGHGSPNAGWPEAALAGALGFALGGPRSYAGELVDLPTMGRGRSALGARDIRAALRLYALMLWLALGAVTLLALFAR